MYVIHTVELIPISLVTYFSTARFAIVSLFFLPGYNSIIKKKTQNCPPNFKAYNRSVWLKACLLQHLAVANSTVWQLMKAAFYEVVPTAARRGSSRQGPLQK